MEAVMSTVLTRVVGGIGTITLTHGKVNALSKQLISEISSALEEMQPPEIRVVIIRASKGAKVFSAGHDVREPPINGRDSLAYDDPLRCRGAENRDTRHTRNRHGRRISLGRRLRAGYELRFDRSRQ
jgi:enoyl-CoA hydratase/carnithine racemase